MNKPARILVVDDDEGTRRTLQLIFEHNGYDCRTAGRAEHGLAMLRDKAYDIVMLDLRLPDALGVDLIEPIKALRPDTSIIIATGYASVDSAIRALDRGASAYVHKPLQMQEVLARIRDLVERQRLVEERRAAEAALRESEARFRSIVETSLIGLLILDRHGQVTYANDELCHLLSRDRESLLGAHFGTFLGPRSIELFAARFAARQRGEEIPNRYPIEVLRDDNEIRQAELVASVMRDAQGNPFTVCQLLDTTEQQRMEERLREAEKMEAVGQLAGGIAHEFNNLLTVINGYTEMLIDQLGVSHAVYPEMQEVLRAGTRAASLTTQLLAFARRQLLRMQPLDLNQMIQEIAARYAPSLPDNVRLTLELADDLGTVNADTRQLEQIAMHLGDNAVDAMPDGGEMRISTSAHVIDRAAHDDPYAPAPGHYALIRISDTGCGMSPEVLSHVFEPFFTTKEVGKGTGLGLATVYGIVKQLGGDIKVESTVNQGTTFSISLPAEPPASAEPAQGAGPLVLVVEDEPRVRRLTVRLLNRLGYRTIEAGDPPSAMAQLEERGAEIRLVLADITLPGGTGPELLNAMRIVRPSLRALYMTGYAPEGGAVSGLHRDGTPIVPKPFDREQLARLIGEALAG